MLDKSVPLMVNRPGQLGHRNLFTAGFLHGDISIGNVFLAADGANVSSQLGMEGFIADLELAIVPYEMRPAAASGISSSQLQPVPRGPEMTVSSFHQGYLM